MAAVGWTGVGFLANHNTTLDFPAPTLYCCTTQAPACGPMMLMLNDQSEPSAQPPTPSLQALPGGVAARGCRCRPKPPPPVRCRHRCSHRCKRWGLHLRPSVTASCQLGVSCPYRCVHARSQWGDIYVNKSNAGRPGERALARCRPGGSGRRWGGSAQAVLPGEWAPKQDSTGGVQLHAQRNMICNGRGSFMLCWER